MVDLNLQVDVRPDRSIFASYTCPCGCNPGVALSKGTDVATEGCCCGNQFAVGPGARGHIEAGRFTVKPGYALQVQPIAAPWGPTEAVWAVGPSTHPVESSGHGHGGHDMGGHDMGGHRMGGNESGGLPAGKALDPVCGMTVDIETAKGKGLHFQHAGADYFFCGKGCRLDFEEDPGRFLDPKYIPSM